MHTNIKRPHAQSSSWTFKQLFAARGGTGTLPGGGVICIGELSGGWTQASLDAFADAEGLPHFTPVDVSTDGTQNSKDESQDASVEVLLDIQAAVARYYFETGKMPVVYILWGQDITAVTEFFHDHYTNAVLSWSWGADEKDWGDAAAQAYGAAAAKCTAAGLAITAASGDNSSSDGSPGANVDLPSADTDTIACGGTSKQHGGPDVVWGDGTTSGNGTGGGYSEDFPLLAWQQGKVPAGASGRMTPDVVDLADPNTGLIIYIAGGTQVIGGTSAVAPWIAGLIAATGQCGRFTPAFLWSLAGTAVYTEVTSGSNGAYAAGPSPEPCTGLGVINTAALAAVLSGGIPVPQPPAPVPAPVPASRPLLEWLRRLLGRLGL